MNLKGVDHWPFVIPHNPAADEIAQRNAKNRKAWEERYKQYYARGQWIKWEAGNFYDLPQRLRGIAAI